MSPFFSGGAIFVADLVRKKIAGRRPGMLVFCGAGVSPAFLSSGGQGGRGGRGGQGGRLCPRNVVVANAGDVSCVAESVRIS